MKRAPVVLVPIVAAGAVVAAAVARAGDLPDPVATHWALGGEPDGSLSLTTLTVLTAAALLLAAAPLLQQARRDATHRLTTAPYAWGATGVLLALTAVTHAANDGAATWQEASEVGPLPALAAVAAGALAACAAHVLERGRPLATTATPTAMATVGLRDGEVAAYAGRLRSRSTTIATAATAGATVVVALLAGGGAGLAIAVAGTVLTAALAGVSELLATVDRRGLTLAYGPAGWPRQRIPLADVAAAEAVDVDPWEVGGWGYRKVPRRPGATAVVLRRGEGVSVRRRDGRELIVTVPDAARAAGLLNDLARRA